MVRVSEELEDLLIGLIEMKIWLFLIIFQEMSSRNFVKW